MSDLSLTQAQGEMDFILSFVRDHSNLEGAAADEAVETAMADIVKVSVYESKAITLAQGGPEVRILIEKYGDGEPRFYSLRHRGWYETWQDLVLTEEEQDSLQEYCNLLGLE